MILSGKKFARDHSETKAEEAGGDVNIKGSELARIHHKDETSDPVEDETQRMQELKLEDLK